MHSCTYSTLGRNRLPVNVGRAHRRSCVYPNTHAVYMFKRRLITFDKRKMHCFCSTIYFTPSHPGVSTEEDMWKFYEM